MTAQRCDAHPGAGWTSRARQYAATADDAAYGIFELEGGIVAQINSSWATRVFRDELVEFQVDGTQGVGLAGLRRVPRSSTGRLDAEAGVEPGPAGHRGVPRAVAGRAGQRARSTTASRSSGRCSCGTCRRTAPSSPWDFLAGARGVQLAELGLAGRPRGVAASTFRSWC